MTMLDPADVARWRSAIGRQQTRSERLEVESLRRYALAIGHSSDVERDPPPLAHWAYFLSTPDDDQIGEDGHPKRGDFLPAVTLPRRMFAASAMTFEAPLQYGATAELVTTIVEVSHKTGRSGDLVFVEIDRVLSQDRNVRVRERQSYVYRAHEGPVPMPKVSRDRIEGELWHPTEVSLFRFSAATFNGHRIHYDLPYARDIEGYPALVIHGPFAASKLAGLASRDRPLRQFSFRAQAPLFLGQSVRLQARESDLRAVRADGTVAMTAIATHDE